MKSFGRGKGESSVAAAAYRAGLHLIDSRTSIRYDYSKRSGVASHHMLAPRHAPDWCLDPNLFWDINESHETRANARVAREVEIALPAELDERQRQVLALALGQMLVDRYQVAVLVAIHHPSGQGDQRNHHVHLLLSARTITDEGLGGRACLEFDAKQGGGAKAIRGLRKVVGEVINEHLSRCGASAKVDHRSLRAQAADAAFRGDFERAHELTRQPTKHLGKSQVAMVRKTKLSTKITGPEAEVKRLTLDLISAMFDKATHEVPQGHSHGAALRDRLRERRSRACAGQNNSEIRFSPIGHVTAGPVGRPKHPLGPRVRQSAPNLTRHLSRTARLTRSQGRDAEVLNAEAELIEKWLDVQRQAAEDSLDLLRTIPGIEVEPSFQEAYEVLICRSPGDYSGKPFLFEDTEALAKSVMRYACMIARPHRARIAFLMARARLSEHEDDPTSPEAARARQTYQRKKNLVSKRILAIQERRTNYARTSMLTACRLLNKALGVRDQTGVSTPHPQQAESISSDGGEWELKFKPKRPGF